jgi:pimeloyl-ACP methyl ester carboxylesterase
MGITDIVLDKGYQMLYLDQRGTGMSATITAETLKLRGGPEAQAEYLKNFRADSIVKDCEAVRKLLTEDYPDELKKWSLLGQSFGGFCAFTYLSKAPAGLREVFTSGGVPPIGKTAPQVYQATFQQVIKRNQAYYAKYPDDIPMVHDLAIYIRSQNGIALPAGGKLTVRRFLMLGMLFGGHGGVDTVHNLILRMHSDLRQFTFLSRPTLSALEGAVGYDDNVIYALLHESIYCDANGPSDWAAERVSKSLTEYQWVTLAPPSAQTVRETPLHFSGEMVYRWMFDVYPELHALKPVADILASYEGWGGLYDEWQLARNEVPVYAATYTEDMYVDFGLVQESIGKVKGVKQWVTSGCYHDAVRSKSGEVMRELFALRDDSID